MSRWVAATLAGAAVWGMLANPAQAQPAKPAAAKAAPAPVPANKTVAVVNGESITWGQLEPVFKLAGAVPADLPETERRELYREALATLVDDQLLTQYLRKYVPAPPKDEVEKKMTELEKGLKEQKKTIKDLCKESQQTEAEIRANIAQFLQWQAYANKQIKEENLQRYYTANKEFFDRIMVRASHVFIRLPATASEQEKSAARTKLQNLRAQIVAGKLDFAAAAKLHSHCPSGKNGGDIGTFPRKFVVDEAFARAAFALKPGEISQVVQSPTGMHLIKVTERTPGEPTTYTKIHDDVRAVYAEEMRTNILTQLRKAAKIQLLLP
jgi:peptidyl-prolyl cis-trans isomerase C